jgi:hypothetical protein
MNVRVLLTHRLADLDVNTTTRLCIHSFVNNLFMMRNLGIFLQEK